MNALSSWLDDTMMLSFSATHYLSYYGILGGYIEVLY
jgi:hypothetical protein